MRCINCGRDDLQIDCELDRLLSRDEECRMCGFSYIERVDAGRRKTGIVNINHNPNNHKGKE